MTEHSPACDSTEEYIANPDRLVLHTSIQGQTLPLLQRVSSYSRLIRVTAWILRYVHNSRHQSRRLGTLTTEELKEGERYWFKEIQHLAFPQEIKALGDNRSLPRTSRLITFRPFVDDEGLLRVGGRIEQGRLSHAKRHPILLPRDHKVVELLIIREHIRVLHAGPTAVSASLAQ